MMMMLAVEECHPWIQCRMSMPYLKIVDTHMSQTFLIFYRQLSDLQRNEYVKKRDEKEEKKRLRVSRK